MDGVERPAEARARLDELRRGLYRPGATEADRLHYAAALDALTASGAPAPARPGALAGTRAAPPVPQPAGSSGASTSQPRRRRLLLAGGLLAAAVATATVIGVSLAAPTRAATAALGADPAASSTPTPSYPVSDLATEPRTVPYPESVDGVDVIAQRTWGSGDAVVPIDDVAAPAEGGRLYVSLSSSDPTPVAWRAERDTAPDIRSSSVQVLASEAPALREGPTRPTSAAYRGAPPTRIVVRAPTGTGWTLTVAFTNGSPSASP